MARPHSAPLLPPISLGHVERPHPSREVSALVAADRGPRASAWADLPPRLRSELRTVIVDDLRSRLAMAKMKLSSNVAPSLESVTEVLQLEESIEIAGRLP